MPYKLENLPRNRRGEYGIKARVPDANAAKSFRARTINDAKQAAMQWVEGVESGQERTSPEITLAEYRAEIADDMKWTAVTRFNADQQWKHIEPRFGKDPLSSIGRSEIRDWLSTMKRKGATASTRAEALKGLMTLLNEAARDGRITTSPNVRQLRPEVEVRKGIALTAAQGQVLLEALPDRYKTVAVVQITTGMRIGELLALRPEDFHRDTMTISVTKSVPMTGPNGRKLADRQVKSPKSKSGRREVPLHPGTLAAVDDHVARFGVSPEGYLFTAERRPHRWLFYGTYLTAFRRAVERVREQDPDFPHVNTHDLRKTFGSWMVANPNVTPMEAARVLGHKNASITLDVYAQLIPGRSEIPAAQAEMARLFGLDPKQLPSGEIVDGEVVSETVCAGCGTPMPAWPKGWRFDEDEAWCPEHREMSHT